jgi:hypothetical protein
VKRGNYHIWRYKLEYELSVRGVPCIGGVISLRKRLRTAISDSLPSSPESGLSKPAQNTRLGLLASEVPERPYQKLFIDYVGKFARSKAGNSMLLVCVDSSKFVWLVPVREATSLATIKPLEMSALQVFGSQRYRL